MARVISAVLTLKDKNFSTNAKKATSALSEAERKTLHAQNTVAGFGKSVSSGFRRVAEGAASMVGAIGITQALSGAINMVKSSFDTAFARIDTMEQFDRTMTVLTGSSENAAKALDVTSEAVKGTAYGLDVAAKGVQDFVTRGLDVDKATERVRVWADAVSFYGEGSNEQLASVTDALGKMSTKGKVEMDQLNRLFDVGIDAVGMYAKATGSSSAVVQEQLSKGAISSEDFIDTVTTAMEEGTNGVTSVAGAAKEAGASWRGTFDNMRVAVARGTMDIVESIDEMLESNGLPNMREMIASVGSKFEGLANKVADKVPAIGGYLVNAYETAKPGIDWAKDTAFPAVRDAIGFVWDKAGGLYNFIKDNFSKIGPVIAGITGAVLFFKAAVLTTTKAKAAWKIATSAVTVATKVLNGTLRLNPLGIIATLIGGVIVAGIALYRNWGTIIGWANKLWSTVKTKFVDLKTNVVGWLGDMKDSASEKFGDIVQAAKDLPGKIGQGIKDFASDAVEGIKELAGNLIKKFKEVLGISSPSKVFFDMAKSIVQGLINGLSIANLKALGKNVFSSFADGAFDTLDKIKGFLSGSGAGGNVKSWIAQAIAITGVPASWAQALETIAMKESGGNPRAVNRWDSNWKRGTPSMGLMQTIEPTFNAHKKAGMGDILNPVHNAVAAINYIKSRYGSVFNVPGIKSMARGGAYRGYALGTSYYPGGIGIVGEHGPELVELPRGSKVASNEKTKTVGDKIVNVHCIFNGVTVGKKEFFDEAGEHIGQKILLALANM